MRPESKKYLFDIRQAAESIAAFCTGKSFEQYRSDELLRAAVERKFGIIGEALVRLDKGGPETAAQIPDRAKIIAFRNIIIHGYAGVDDKIVWGVIEGDLPSLRAAVASLLGRSQPSCPLN
jgi:uncharacterized protein with HEPN domain